MGYFFKLEKNRHNIIKKTMWYTFLGCDIILSNIRKIESYVV